VEIDRRQKELAQVQSRKNELRSTVLARQTDLPVWWNR
jgi:hypothetical protein